MPRRAARVRSEPPVEQLIAGLTVDELRADGDHSRLMANRRRSRRRASPRTWRETKRSLLDAIAEGYHLGAIAAAVDARRRLVRTIDSSHMLATLCVGDRVRIGHRVSPRYLAGLDGTIVELDDRAATVRLDFPVGRFESGRVRCPPLVLEKPA